MKHWKILLPLALLLSASWFACRDQDFDDDEIQADVAFAGRVIDEDGQPVEGALVRTGNELAITDANGVFRTKAVRLSARDAKLSISKTGYFDFSRAYVVQDDALQTVTIQLLRKELVGAFSGSAGGTVQVPGGVSLNFPAGSVNAAGQVHVFARYLDPTSPNLSLQMPGDLRAINVGGEEGTLATFGMLGVELSDQSGQPLQIADGSEVEITMPIAPNQLSTAPATIALWYYDHDLARWIEEGTAQKVGNQYVGKVKHFSFWNCDAFSATVYMEGQVFLRDLDHPLSNVVVRLTVLSNSFQGFGYTNSEGWFGGAVPKDYAMKLEVLIPDQCGGQVMYTQDIGPFSSDATLPPIIISNLPPQVPAVTFSGILKDCNGQAVSAGYAKIEVGDNVYAAFADSDGTFETYVFNCDNSTTASVIAYDLVNLFESTIQNFNVTPDAVDLGAITVCSALSEYIQYQLDGQNFTLLDPAGYVLPDSFNVNVKRIQLIAADSLVQDQAIWMMFNSDNPTGTFSMMAFYVNGLETHLNQAINITTILTNTGDVGELITGTFSGNFQATDGTNHSISGSYRVIRDL